MKSFWERIGESMGIEAVTTTVNKIQDQHKKFLQENKTKEQTAKTNHEEENKRIWVFGKKSYQAFRG